MRRVLLLLAATALTVLLAACGPGTEPTTPSPDVTVTAPSPTPTPTPTPTAPPALADLAISADGLGTLLLGNAPDTDPATAMIVEDPEACVSAGATPGTPEALRWRPIPLYFGSLYEYFGVEVSGGVVRRVDVFDDTIPTDAGIRIGDTRAAALAAYPDATITSNQLADILLITGDHGSLQVEIATNDPYWDASQANHVRYIHASVVLEPFSVVASENLAGGCL
ncbi:hypothetical protein BH09ACT4_BH09ACT4_09500 [soil metagenome]